MNFLYNPINTEQNYLTFLPVCEHDATYSNIPRGNNPTNIRWFRLRMAGSNNTANKPTMCVYLMHTLEQPVGQDYDGINCYEPQHILHIPRANKPTDIIHVYFPSHSRHSNRLKSAPILNVSQCSHFNAVYLLSLHETANFRWRNEALTPDTMAQTFIAHPYKFAG